MREINLLEGKVVAKEGMKVAIVASRFNEIIVNKLLGGAVDGLVRHGVEENNITAAWVPGAFEIPVVAKKMAASGKYDAVICVGAVIRGNTSHYDYVCNEVSKGIASVSLETGVPVGSSSPPAGLSSPPSSGFLSYLSASDSVNSTSANSYTGFSRRLPFTR